MPTLPGTRAKNIDWWALRYPDILDAGYKLDERYKLLRETLVSEGSQGVSGESQGESSPRPRPRRWNKYDGHTTVSALFSCYQC